MKTITKTFLTTAPTLLTSVLSIVLMATASAHAQDKTAPPPPKLEKLEEITEADIKMAKPKAAPVKMKERRENGITKEVEVTSGNSTYVVKPNPAPTGTREGDAVRPAMWKVKEFGGKKDPKEDTKVSTDPDALPVLPPGQYSTSKNGVTKTETKPASPAEKAAEKAAAKASASASASASVSSAETKPTIKQE